jgi:hypothetical protein
VTPAKISTGQTGAQSLPAAATIPADAAGKADGAEKIERPVSAARAGSLVPAARRPWLLAAAATVLVLLVVTFVVLSHGADNSNKAHNPTPGPTATTGGAAAPPGSSPGQPAGPGGGPAAGPNGTPPAANNTPPAPVMLAGWQMYTDPTGFSVAAPAGWTVSHEGTILYFRDPNSARILGIDQSNQPNGDPVADWKDQRDRRVPAGDFPGYQEVGIRPVNYWKACADWEFSYDRGGGRTHAINRGFVTSDHQAYGIWWSTSESTWQDDLKYFNLITSTFTPKP